MYYLLLIVCAPQMRCHAEPLTFPSLAECQRGQAKLRTLPNKGNYTWNECRSVDEDFKR